MNTEALGYFFSAKLMWCERRRHSVALKVFVIKSFSGDAKCRTRIVEESS